MTSSWLGGADPEGSRRVWSGPAPLASILLGALLLGLAVVAVPGAGAVAAAPTVRSEAGLLVDLTTGRVLFAKNAQGDRAPASLVKLMTLYLAYADLEAGRVQLDDRVTVSANAAHTPRFRLGLVAATEVPLETLLAGVAVASANDAATAVAEHLGGSVEGFVGRMNAEAQRMGLVQTVFANPHGLPDPQQRTTARDMAVLVEHLLRDFPDSRSVLGETEFTWRGRTFRRNITLFRDPGGVTALKTGFTLEAGYNLAVTAAKAGQRLVCVILGAETRGLSFVEAGRLLKFGFGEPPTAPRRWRGRTAGVRAMGGG